MEKEHISKIDFERLFNKPGEDVIIRNKTIAENHIGNIKLNSENFNCRSVKIENCTFYIGFIFEKINLEQEIIIQACEFFILNFEYSTLNEGLKINSTSINQLILSNIQSQSVIEINFSQITRFTINKLNLNCPVVFNGIIVEKQLSFLNCKINPKKDENVYLILFKNDKNNNPTKEEVLHALTNDASKIAVTFRNFSRYANEIEIQNYKKKIRENEQKNGSIDENGIYFRNDCQINAPIINFEIINSPVIAFNDSKFNKISFTNGNHPNTSEIDELFFENSDYKDIEINDLKINLLKIFRNKISKTFKISKSILNKIHLEDTEFGTSFNLNGNYTLIEEVDIHCSLNLKGTVQFNDCNIQNFKIQKDNHAGNYIFNNCKFNQLTFDRFNNYNGNFTLSTCESFENNSVIYINQSNLGKTQLFNVDLNSFEVIKIDNAQMSEIVISNVTWFDQIKLNNGNHKLLTYNKMREIYRQLKQVCEKNGNHIKALDFKALELNNFRKELKGKKGKCGDKIILCLSSTNDFGVNWWKPILYLLPFVLFFYISIVLLASKDLECSFDFSNWNNTLKVLCKHIELLPQFFNPTRPLLDKTIFDITFWVNVLDFFQRITLLFFTFQTVSAFRKFIK